MTRMADTDDEDDDLPRGVALAWGVAASPQRGPKREMSVERIVEAAVEIADAEGLGAVSMAAVAARLGYTPMSLYRYVTAKDDLVLLMQEEATGLPPESVREVEGWRGAARGALPRACCSSTSSTRGCSRSRSTDHRPPRTAPHGWMPASPRCADTPLTHGERLSIVLLHHRSGALVRHRCCAAYARVAARGGASMDRASRAARTRCSAG